MKRTKSVYDFDFYIDEYMYNCRSRKLRRKTLQVYEQSLRLFERWCLDVVGITGPEEIREATFRRYICPCCGNSVRATKVVNIGCLDYSKLIVLAR